MKQLILCWFMLLSLTACTNYFGLSKEEWDALSPAQQTDVVQAYNQRQAERQRAENERAIIAEQNAPLNNLIGALGTAIPNQGKERSTTTTNSSCNASGTNCTTTSKTRSSGWNTGN